nr:CAP-Gly domain-containing linker protein 4-like [Anser cygnoides]
MPLEMADAAASAKEIKQILLDAVSLSCDVSKAVIPNHNHVTGKAMLLSLGLKLGDRVVIAGQKIVAIPAAGPNFSVPEDKRQNITLYSHC